MRRVRTHPQPGLANWLPPAGACTRTQGAGAFRKKRAKFPGHDIDSGARGIFPQAVQILHGHTGMPDDHEGAAHVHVPTGVHCGENYKYFTISL